MESNDVSVDVVHPEVRAHITSLVSALGGVDEDGQYQLGDDALDVLRDIKKWIRFYDQKLNRLDVARCLAETNLVGGDLLRILATWPENSTTTQRFKARIALACFEVLTPLTWPLDKDPETATVNHYRHLPVLQLAQVAYKRAIINFDGAPILHTAVRVALPSLAIPLGDRALRDQGIIKLVLYFLRNVAMIEPPPGVVYDGDESQISRSATIDAFAYQDIFLVLLTLASNMGEDFRTEDTTVMEIIFHLVKGVDLTKLFMDETQLQRTNANELTDMMNKESAMLQSFQKHAPTRHSRFGTMVWVDRGQGKMSALSGQDALTSSSARELKMDSSKKYRPPRRGRRRRLGEEKDMGMGTAVPLNARANGQLRSFVEDFLDAGFNPLFQHLRKSLDREAPHVLHHHRAQFLYLVSWFLEAERVRHKARSAKEKNKSQKDNSSDGGDITSFNLVAGVLNQEMFIFLGRALDRSHNDKDWQELTVVMRCFTQILLTVQEMSESRNEENEEIAENILSRLFYEETTHDAIANIVKNFKDQGYDYLDACTELAHTYLRILESYSKQNVDLQVRSRRRTRKKKKAAAKAAAAASNPAGAAENGEQADEQGNNADDDDDDESVNDAELAQKTSTERKFDFKRFANRFVAQGVIDTFVKFTSNYRDLTDTQLKRAHRYFYRIAFKQEMSVMLFRVDIVRLFYNMIKGPEPLEKGATAMYKEWEELSKQILRKCMKKIEERPVLLIEMLFSKSASTAHFLEYGFEKQTLSVTHPKPGAELEFRHEFEPDRQIAIAVGVLLDKNQLEHITFVKKQLAAAETERRAWQLAEMAANDAASLADADALPTVAPVPAPSNETADAAEQPVDAEGSMPAPATELFPASEAPPITVRPDDEECRKAMFKNSHLRLLMRLVGFQRLAPALEETPDSAWIVPSQLTADQLHESLEFIGRAEFAPPTFDNDESAENQLKRKTAPRKKAVYDDDDENDLIDDEVLFPEGGPTARKVVDGGLDEDGNPKKKKTIRRRRRRRRSNEEDEVGPTEEELDERARKRRQKELEKARRIKSDLYVHASDDETDDEKDAEFFAREEATRQRVHKTVMEEFGAAAAAAEAAAAKDKTSKRKRNPMLLSDDDDDEDEDSLAGLSQEPATLVSRRKRRKSSESDSSDSDQEAEDESTHDSASKAKATRKLAPRKRFAGFVDSSSDEDEDDEVINADAMDTDDTPLSSSPHPAEKEKGATVEADRPTSGMDVDQPESTAAVLDKAASAGIPTAATTAMAEDSDDDDDIRPAVGARRSRVKTGFLMDSDDDE